MGMSMALQQRTHWKTRTGTAGIGFNRSIDIAPPPTGSLIPFNMYVALSLCCERGNVMLLCDFGEKLLTSHPSEYIIPQVEDERLA